MNLTFIIYHIFFFCRQFIIILAIMICNCFLYRLFYCFPLLNLINFPLLILLSLKNYKNEIIKINKMNLFL